MPLWLGFPPSLPRYLLPHHNTHCSHTTWPSESTDKFTERLEHTHGNFSISLSCSLIPFSQSLKTHEQYEVYVSLWGKVENKTENVLKSILNLSL